MRALNYNVQILRRAQKELAALPPLVYPRMCDAIRDLAGNPRPPGSEKLVGRSGWRIRVGDYRIIYEIDDSGQIITVMHIGRWRDVYDQLVC